MATTVTRKWQITIPKPVRAGLGLAPGDAVLFEWAPDGRVVLCKAVTDRPASRFDSLRGCAGPGLSTDAIMALTRGEG
ncbi:MAG: AbrB/MazE/SpoVT family DNA-binding domain-containing protein [Magnetococcales bacterium]|nr:AbrB/MazE/SpoVT family DNA-binding domain-containing protein [Magnetococcales bacterium]